MRFEKLNKPNIRTHWGGQIVLGMAAVRCMETTSHRWFDPHFGAQLLLEIAQEHSAEPILKRFVERAEFAPGYAVIAILWIAFSDAVVTRLNLPPAVMTMKGAVHVESTPAGFRVADSELGNQWWS